jgi:hypothetical protein
LVEPVEEGADFFDEAIGTGGKTEELSLDPPIDDLGDVSSDVIGSSMSRSMSG